MSQNPLAGFPKRLPNFIEAVNTAAPNGTVPVVSFTAINAAANVDIALSPKGTGAVTAQVADNTVTGGNKRGEYAVDWQTTRSLNTQVASGSASVIGGGERNRATGNLATIAGGGSCVAGALAATVGGGDTNLANGTYSTVCGGWANTASGGSSTIPGGERGHTQAIYSKYAYASGRFAANGDCQRGNLTLRQATITDTTATLTSNGGAASSTNQLVLQDNQMMTVRGQVAARRSVAQADQVAAYEFTAVIRRGSGVGSTVLSVSTVTELTNGITGLSATPSTVIGLTAETASYGCLTVTVTGVAATNIRWLCTINSSEVIFA